ncbi:hypothetical protein T02_7473 [Trichinella nativa]|uniref:Uncharacterized protein n=1 Tax=Trichinella nativa TaxID=6335 RepID=A0A0V1KN27_9BILA|nr:hypothetical protein T02_7473 [Trichinella nativa]
MQFVWCNSVVVRYTLSILYPEEVNNFSKGWIVFIQSLRIKILMLRSAYVILRLVLRKSFPIGVKLIVDFGISTSILQALFCMAFFVAESTKQHLDVFIDFEVIS